MHELSLMKIRYRGGPPVAYDHTQLVSVPNGEVGILYSGFMHAHLAWQYDGMDFCLGPQLFRLKAGQCVFGGAEAHRRNSKSSPRIALRSDKSARMITLPAGRLSELATHDDGSTRDILTSVENWVVQLAQSIAPRALQDSDAQPLELKPDVHLDKAKVAASKELVWVRVVSGKVLACDEPHLAISSQCAARNLYFPVVNAIWLRSCSEATCIDVTSSQYLLANGLLWLSIENFNRRILQHIRMQDQMPISTSAEQTLGSNIKRLI